jgi:hypothetical protein
VGTPRDNNRGNEREEEDLKGERDRDHDVSVHRGDLSRNSGADVSRPCIEPSLGESRRRSGDDPISRHWRPGYLSLVDDDGTGSAEPEGAR